MALFKPDIAQAQFKHEDHLSRYRLSNNEDKTLTRPPYLNTKNFFTGKVMHY